MKFLIKHPLIVLSLSFFLLWLSAKIGLFVRKRQLKVQKDVHQDLDIIVSATLTLLALIIGFSFSNPVSGPDLFAVRRRFVRNVRRGQVLSSQTWSTPG